jgi:hypothetical protein
MSLFVRRQVPIAIVAITSILVMADYFLKIPQTGPVVKDLQNWGIILSAFALGFGAVNLFIVHTRHISKHASGQWPFSIWLLFMLVVFAGIGVFVGPSSTSYMWIYNASYFALSATIYSSTGFYIASGCYRALRARNAQAVILLIVGSLALLRNAPAMASAFPILISVDSWLNSVPTTSAQRGIMIGAALGAIALGVRTMIGRETGFLGRRTEAER